MRRVVIILLGLSFFIASATFKTGQFQQVEVIDLTFDPYARDCFGGISILTKDSVHSFIKPSDAKYRMPDGLVASGSNKITFFGHYGMIKCIHLMGENNPHPEKFFVYDSVLVHCPYKFFDIEKMAFDSISCGRHPSFHDRIKFE